LLSAGGSFLFAPRREFAPAWRVTFFAGAKKVTKETPNTSLFGERWFGAGAQTWGLDSASGHWRSGNVFGWSLRDITSRLLRNLVFVIPAKAGIQGMYRVAPCTSSPNTAWIPAFAGMTEE
jgi:hypothetical protein